MPGKMAEILRDRRQIAVLDMGSAFSWSISGKGAPAGMLTDMDFAIRRGPGTVPEELLREKAGKNPCAQLRLAQEGGPFVPVGSTNRDQKASTRQHFSGWGFCFFLKGGRV